MCNVICWRVYIFSTLPIRITKRNNGSDGTCFFYFFFEMRSDGTCIMYVSSASNETDQSDPRRKREQKYKRIMKEEETQWTVHSWASLETSPPKNSLSKFYDHNGLEYKTNNTKVTCEYWKIWLGMWCTRLLYVASTDVSISSIYFQVCVHCTCIGIFIDPNNNDSN